VRVSWSTDLYWWCNPVIILITLWVLIKSKCSSAIIAELGNISPVQPYPLKRA
jgi:surface polysaccharide O-acyltransferase-like enzyme